MVKKACYVIIPNAVLYQKYKSSTSRVFKDEKLEWTEVEYISGYWQKFETDVWFNYQGVIKKLTNIMVDLMEESCCYHMDRHKFFSEILYEMKMGETVFVKYEDATKLLLKKHLIKKYSSIVEAERQRQIEWNFFDTSML
jgi:hypothetical protein